MSVQNRIEAAERELAAAKAELAAEQAKPKYDPNALYLIEQGTGSYLARGDDMSTKWNAPRAERFVTLPDRKGNPAQTFSCPGSFDSTATVTKIEGLL